MMLAHHVVTFKEKPADNLKEYNFLSVLRVNLQKVVVAFKFQNQASHCVKRVDRSQDYFALVS